MTKRRFLFFFPVLVLIPLLTYIVFRFVNGERFDFKKKTLEPTGLLVASSTPDGASVYVDGQLKTATNDTLNLSPASYEVEIKKEGFYSWKKRLEIEKELVTKTDAFLFSSFPSLKSLTYTGAENPALSPDNLKVAYTVVLSDGKQGIWLMDLPDRPFGLTREPRQILKDDSNRINWEKSVYSWSPDSKEILTSLTMKSGLVQNYLIETDKLSNVRQLVEVSPALKDIKTSWEKEKTVRQEELISKMPKELREILKGSARDALFSPNDKKVLYTATASATIPDNLKPPLPASNSQPESRQIETGKIYVYDSEEDKNFFIVNEKEIPSLEVKSTGAKKKSAEPVIKIISQPLYWFPTSRHLFLVRENKATILEYDNTNWQDVYSGPFENGFAFPFPSGDKILILASLGENAPRNLYAASLR